eukprot:m.14536 g.14536  ORF g.14536 m.14536 type:complete len:304 (+) comp25806_c0_seq2:318-1229(+)
MDNLRPLTNEDTVQVQEICKGVFNGVDYLPGRITSWLKDENIHSLGLDLNGTLIGTISAELDDDRKVAVLKGLRVRSGYRSRGHGSLLTSAMMDFVQKAFPTVQRFVTTEDADGKLKATADWKEIFRRYFFCAELTEEILLSHTVSGLLNSDPQLQISSLDQLCTALVDERRAFFPATVIREVGILLANRNSINRSVKRGDVWFIRGDAQATSVSSGSFFPAGENEAFRMWSFDIFCTTESDMEFHFAEQLKRGYRHVARKPFVFSCTVPEELADFAKEMTARLTGVKQFGEEFFSVIKEKQV